MTDKLAAIKRDSRRKSLMAGYEKYRRREPNSMDDLLALVRDFALVKLKHLEHDFKQFSGAETVDDWAQNVTIDVWKNLEKFANNPKSTPASFYSWVHRIAFTRGAKTFNELKEEYATKAPLFVTGEDQDGEQYEEENPALHEERGGFSGSWIPIPASVQGVDRSICKLLQTTVQHYDKKKDEYTTRPRNYRDVAFILGLTENAVKKRLKRLRDRMMIETEAARVEQQKMRAAQEAERRDSVAIGLARLRGAKSS